jgi:hypothetical protein
MAIQCDSDFPVLHLTANDCCRSPAISYSLGVTPFCCSVGYSSNTPRLIMSCTKRTSQSCTYRSLWIASQLTSSYSSIGNGADGIRHRYIPKLVSFDKQEVHPTGWRNRVSLRSHKHSLR